MSLKFLDYGKPNPFRGTIGKPRKLAWPVNAYRITLPKAPEDSDGLNPFERVILKIIDACGIREPEALARETCIPIDFVQCILLRLQDKAFIDEYNEIIVPKYDGWKKREEEESGFVTALLFHELATGKILPFLHQLDDNNLLKTKEEERFKKILENDEYKDTPPTPRDAIIALRAMKKRSKAFGDATYLKLEQITIANEPEFYHLDCPIAIQKSDGEFRIANPFGNGFSLLLENAFNHLLEQNKNLSDWIMDWRENLSNHKQDQQIAIEKEPYDNDANWRHYPNLISNLRLDRNKRYRSIEQIHAILEWALFYTCAQRSFDTVVNQLKITHQSGHSNLLKEAGRKIGLNLPQHEFLPIKMGRLDDFLSGKAHMETVLYIALLMAGNDASHPLRRIASQHQDFVMQLIDIRKKRNDPAHGKGKLRKNETELPEEAFMREIVTVLLPDIWFSNTPGTEIDRDAVADSLFEARTNIQNEFTFGLFNRLGINLQDRLIYAERFWLFYQDGDDALAFIRDLYAALQATFTNFQDGLPPEISESEFVQKATEKAASAGLGELPECLRTVKLDAIRKTLQGDSQTLGACVLAFLLVTDDDVLCSIAGIQPSFISDVAEIIIRRGHGNDPLPLPKKDIGKLRKSTYSTIKTLLES